MTRPKPPTHDLPSDLGPIGTSWLTSLVAEFVIEPHDLPMAIAAARELDNAELARQQLAKDGNYIKDRFGVIKSHPAREDQKQAHLAFKQLVRELGLNVEGPSTTRGPLPRGYR